MTQVKLFGYASSNIDTVIAHIERDLNTWLQENYHQIIDIQFQMYNEAAFTEVWCMVIYRPLEALK